MKPLNGGSDLAAGSVDSVVRGFSFADHDAATKEELRSSLAKAGYVIRRMSPKAANARFLAADCAFASAELRYHALWAAHAVAVSGIHDGSLHRDLLVGNGTQPYGGLSFSNYVGAGELIPYSDVEVRCNLARVAFESNAMIKAEGEAESDGKRPDFFLVDGSLYTNLTNLKRGGSEYPETGEAEAAFDAVLGLGRVVGMVEDSHATDISRRLGYEFTNMLLFDIALEAGEYVVDRRDGINICYLKLQGKPLPYLPNGMSGPLTARWEFGYDGFEGDLDLLSGLWLLEEDILHPQLYPLRAADYLSRKIKVGGILDEIVESGRLEAKYRDMREG